jgi:hypothetical protein
MRLAAIFWVLGGFFATSYTMADDHVVEPRGDYAKIDVGLANRTVATLLRGKVAERNAAVEAVQKSPEKYAPPVLFALSNVLFDRGLKDDGAFWFYAGQLRARYDANRCSDVSARAAVGVLTEKFGPPINEYMFQDFARLEALILRVVEWDRKTSHGYDHRWINLHGMAAIVESLDESEGKPKPMSLPRDQWDAIAEKTRTDYLEGMRQAGAMLKERAAHPSPPPVPAPSGWERRLVGTWHVNVELQGLPSTGPMLIWKVGPDTLSIVNPMVEASTAAPPMSYRIGKIEGNVVTLQITPPGQPPDDWTLEYLEPSLIRLVEGSQEIYRLQRVVTPPR